jgi:ABC-type transporter Mla subunit MlaD
MNEELSRQMIETAGRLAGAADALNRVLDRLDAQQEALNAKVDRIVAAVEDGSDPGGEPEGMKQLQERVAELEKSNSDLRAQAARVARKTLSPAVSALLGKEYEGMEKMDAAKLDRALQSLSVEQRIAVKAEMARAGMIE